MGRELRRVPIDFDWPQGETWDGYLLPKRLHERDCDSCKNGYSPEAERLHDRWYGYVPFDPAETGSTPWTAETPEVRAFAERNVKNAPEYYGQSEASIVREAQRLAALWNEGWSHHLAQEDVDVLVEEGRLMDFTYEYVDGKRQKRDPMPTITAAEVNRWSLGGMGHDSLNCMIVIRAACERLGVPEVCLVCEGHGSVERWSGQRAEAEAWEPVEPPEGDGWQMWETTSEGSPMSPVFATPEELAAWLAETGASMFGGTTATKDHWLSIITGEDFAHVEIAPGVVVM